MAAVRRRGWAVVDGALGTSAAAALAAEARDLGAHAPTRQRLMRQNCTHFVHDGAAHLLQKVRYGALSFSDSALPSAGERGSGVERSYTD